MFVTVLKCYLHLMIAIYDIYYGRLKTDLQQDLQQALRQALRQAYGNSFRIIGNLYENSLLSLTFLFKACCVNLLTICKRTI